MVNPTLSSALSSFTSEFGMGSGGSYSLLSPGNSVLIHTATRSLPPYLIQGKTGVTEKIGKVERGWYTFIMTKRLSVIWSSRTGN